MTTLVGGCAALHDLLGTVDSVAGFPISRLEAGPALEGRWLPGGAAPTVALAMAAGGARVALWHPLPRSDAEGALVALQSAGIDLSRAPRDERAARCILLQAPGGSAGWSAVPDAFDAPVAPDVLDGVEHLVLCPRWGPWATSLLATARDRGIPCSIVGMVPPPGSDHWKIVVVSEQQADPERWAAVDADILVVTQGAAGARIRMGSDWLEIPVLPTVTVDPTGAGDVFGGTFLAAIDAGGPVRAAAEAAAEAAARCCAVWGAQTSLVPPAVRSEADQPSRVRGALWGLACGDAFGMPASFLPRATMRRLWPAGLTELEPAPRETPYHHGYPAGRISDDTEQALALTRALLASGAALDPAAVARELDAWFTAVGGEASPAVGPSTRRGLLALRAGVPLTESGRTGTSNGAAMRIAPIGALHGLRGSSTAALVADVVAACLATHNTGPAISAAAAVAGAVGAAIAGAGWAEVLAAGRAAAQDGRAQGAWVYAPDVPARIDLAIELAMSAPSDGVAAERLATIVGTGEPSVESVPAAFGIAARVQGDPQRAIVLAANTEGDTDTIGAMAGSICGAWAGEAALPQRWREQVAATNGLDVAAWAAELTACAAGGDAP
ncbi:MAG TPA: PfkB family carbohydrate kinase [Candidatus Limnocylindrales bacterium]|nr:PfkB family carbohydrate kinase [Candidatus Limnocylindrales bacterium]